MPKLRVILIACLFTASCYGQQSQTMANLQFYNGVNAAFIINQRNHHSFIERLLPILKEFENRDKPTLDTTQLKIETDSIVDLTRDILSLINSRTEINKKIGFKQKVTEYINNFSDLCESTFTVLRNRNTSLSQDQLTKSKLLLFDKISELERNEGICKIADKKMLSKYHITTLN
jgi:hypothetical protein